MSGVEKHEAVVTPGLVQGTGVVATQSGSGTVTASQMVARGAGGEGTVIGSASEAFDMPGGGANVLVGHEAACIDLDHDADNKPKAGYNAVAKIHMDGETCAPRDLSNASAFLGTAQPETRWQQGVKMDPGTLASAMLVFEGNDVPLARVSGSSLVRRDGRLFVPYVVDGVVYGLPLTYLGVM